MQLKRLSIVEMVMLSRKYLDPMHPAQQALAEAKEVSGLLAELREVYHILLAGSSRSADLAGSLQIRLMDLDSEHEDLMYGIRCMFRSLILLSEDDEVRVHWERLREELLSGDRATAYLPRQVAGANAVLMEQVLHGLPLSDQNLLKNQRLGQRSLFELIERWILTGKELAKGELESFSSSISPTDATLQEARKQWVRIVGAMIATLEAKARAGELPGSAKRHFLDPLRIATKGQLLACEQSG